ncbi:unnamed protein product [Peniophora sp. CBMAI 1063]|nr:unnamed protein product [Peniophora sp. CBMAI 1063]
MNVLFTSAAACSPRLIGAPAEARSRPLQGFRVSVFVVRPQRHGELDCGCHPCLDLFCPPTTIHFLMPKDTSNSTRPLLAVRTMNQPYPMPGASTSPDSAISPTAPNHQSAAHKARILFKNTMTEEEAIRDQKKLASNSRLSIATGTTRLFPLPPTELQLVQRSGQATSGRFSVTNGIISLDDTMSDGNINFVPSPEQQHKKVDARGRVDQHVQLAERDETHKHWVKTIGRIVAYHMFGGARNDVYFRIKLPHGYTLWHHVDGTASEENNARKDKYLYGCTTHGSGKMTFRSPAEFAPHFMWLMLGRPEGGCKCQYCSHRPQDLVSSELFGYVPKSEDMDSPQPVRGRQASAAENKKPRAKKVKPADKPIVAKNYTKML